jgi:S-methylmethionine-dependent homocysteine/selenocysteine methylase
MSPRQAEEYHAKQIDTFAASAADMVCATTMNYVEEALGIAQAARRAGMPVAILFTVETDGRLPTSQPLRSAVEQVDAETSGYPAYYGINCAHPAHFERVVADGGSWLKRIGALRANASIKSHAELNEATELDAGDPEALAEHYGRLKTQLARLNVMGGCCGTDHRHVERIAETCSVLFAR